MTEPSSEWRAALRDGTSCEARLFEQILLVSHQLSRRHTAANPPIDRSTFHIIRRVVDSRLKLLLKRVVAVCGVQLLRQLRNALLIRIHIALKHLGLKIDVYGAAS